MGYDMSGFDIEQTEEEQAAMAAIATENGEIVTTDAVTAMADNVGVPPDEVTAPGVAAGEDYEAEIGTLTGKIGDVQDRRELTVSDMNKAQAYESIISNLIKGYAAYRGFKSGTDMSGVDIKTGIDWNAALQGKLGVLKEESEELKGQRVQKYRNLAARVAESRAAGKDATNAKMAEQRLNLTKRSVAIAEGNAKSLEALRLATIAEKEKEKIGDFKAVESEITASRKSHDTASAELTKYMGGKDAATIKDNLTKSKEVIAKVLNVDRAELDGLDEKELGKIHTMATVRARDNSKAGTILLSQINNAKEQGDTTRLKKLMEFKDDLANGQLTTDVPEGKLLLSKKDKLMSLGKDSIELDKLITAAGNNYIVFDTAEKDVLKKIKEGEPITDMEANLLPNSLIPEKEPENTPDNRAQFPTARVGIGQAGKPVVQSTAAPSAAKGTISYQKADGTLHFAPESSRAAIEAAVKSHGYKILP